MLKARHHDSGFSLMVTALSSLATKMEETGLFFFFQSTSEMVFNCLFLFISALE